jgi:hypothetical protein
MTTELDKKLTFVTNILPLLTNIKSVDIRGVGDDIMDLWAQNESQLAKRLLTTANLLYIELVFVFIYLFLHPEMILIHDFSF